MKFPKIEVAYTIIFNNTGLDWTDIQTAACTLIERKYCVLHCIGDKWHEELGVGSNYVVIKDVPCELYFRVSNMQIDIVAIKSVFKDIENRKWICGNPNSSKRELFLVTVNRKSDNHKWVQDMIWDGCAEKWLWYDDPKDKLVDESGFEIMAWQPMPTSFQNSNRDVYACDTCDTEEYDKW